MNLFNVTEILYRELNKAEEKHPGWPDDIFEQICIILEELGELAQAALDHKYSKTKDIAGEVWDILARYLPPEEVTRLYDKMREKFPAPNLQENIKKEASQVGAMGIRFLMNLEEESK